jgi:hypothetical protein
MMAEGLKEAQLEELSPSPQAPTIPGFEMPEQKTLPGVVQQEDIRTEELDKPFTGLAVEELKKLLFGPTQMVGGGPQLGGGLQINGAYGSVDPVGLEGFEEMDLGEIGERSDPFSASGRRGYEDPMQNFDPKNLNMKNIEILGDMGNASQAGQGLTSLDPAGGAGDLGGYASVSKGLSEKGWGGYTGGRHSGLTAEDAENVQNATGGGGSFLCTELHRQGLMSDELYEADSMYGKTVNPTVYAGYAAWAPTVAKAMGKSKLLTWIAKPFILGWARNMARRMGVKAARFSVLGYVVEKVGVPICRKIGEDQEKEGVWNQSNVTAQEI